MTYYSEHNPPIEETRPITSRELTGDTRPSLPPRKRGRGCAAIGARPLIFLLVLAAYFSAPFNTKILILGIDRALKAPRWGAATP